MHHTYPSFTTHLFLTHFNNMFQAEENVINSVTSKFLQHSQHYSSNMPCLTSFKAKSSKQCGHNCMIHLQLLLMNSCFTPEILVVFSLWVQKRELHDQTRTGITDGSNTGFEKTALYSGKSHLQLEKITKLLL